MDNKDIIRQYEKGFSDTENLKDNSRYIKIYLHKRAYLIGRIHALIYLNVDRPCFISEDALLKIIRG